MGNTADTCIMKGSIFTQVRAFFYKQCFHNEIHVFLQKCLQFSWCVLETHISLHQLHTLFLKSLHSARDRYTSQRMCRNSPTYSDLRSSSWIQNSKSVFPGFSIVIMEVKCYNLLRVNICPIAFDAMKTQVWRIPFMVAFKDTMGRDI